MAIGPEDAEGAMRRTAVFAALCGVVLIAHLYLGPTPGVLQTVVASALFVLLLAIAHVDFLAHRIPDPYNLALAALGLVWVAVDARGDDVIAGSVPAALAVALVCIVVYGAVFWLVRAAFFRWRGVVGLGLGDVKFAAAAGAWLDLEALAGFVFLAAASGLVWVLVEQRRLDRSQLHLRLAFGPHLAFALWFHWLLLKL